MLRSGGVLLVGAVALWLCVAALAQNLVDDRHVTTDPARALCSQSAYVHGYIHGYEDGFRRGDLVLHLGREARPAREFQEFRKAPGYRQEFGDHGFFKTGYQRGFLAAYEDAVSGNVFRGEGQIRDIAEGLNGWTGKRKDLDQAVAAGYEAGREAGLQHTRGPDADSEQCLTAHDYAYCHAFAGGFHLGYSDGLVSQQTSLTHTAKKR